MNVDKLKKAINEATRFQKAAKAALARLEWDRTAYISGSTETAAAKRASMDLTRALAEMRKP